MRLFKKILGCLAVAGVLVGLASCGGGAKEVTKDEFLKDFNDNKVAMTYTEAKASVTKKTTGEDSEGSFAGDVTLVYEPSSLDVLGILGWKTKEGSGDPKTVAELTINTVTLTNTASIYGSSKFYVGNTYKILYNETSDKNGDKKTLELVFEFDKTGQIVYYKENLKTVTDGKTATSFSEIKITYSGNSAANKTTTTTTEKE